MNPQIDAVQLARCIYIGNSESFWDTLSDYTNVDTDELSPVADLVLSLCVLIKDRLCGDPDLEPDAWFDLAHTTATQARP